MGFWKHRETDLERDLRAQRPQPRDQFVQMLSSQSAAPKPGRSAAARHAVPRIALVAAVTVVLAASLGVAGALGHATSSVESFGTSVYHIVQVTHPIAQDLSRDQGGNNDNNGNGNNNGNGDGNTGGQGSGDPGDDRDHEGHDPFHREYHHRVPICHDGEIVFVPVQAFLPLILSGERRWKAPVAFNPPRCSPRS